MTLQNALITGLLIAAFSFAFAQDNEAITKDLARLQGEWSMVSGTADGYPIPKEMLPNSKRVCKGDELTATEGSSL